MHRHINYSNGSRGENIWVSRNICATGKIIPNSNQVEVSNPQNTHCEWSREKRQSDRFQIRHI